MIAFDVWFSQIVTTCELVASEDALERTWVGRERTLTSIIDFGELYEQVFGDLDSEACLAQFASMMSPDTRSTITAFLRAVKEADVLIGKDPDLKASDRLLGHSVWKQVQAAANAVISLREAQQYRSHRADITLQN